MGQNGLNGGFNRGCFRFELGNPGPSDASTVLTNEEADISLFNQSGISAAVKFH